MTTVATVAGHFPLTLVTGAGAVARNSIGIVLVGGMSIGTLFTLFIVPSLYVLLAKDHRSCARRNLSRRWKRTVISGNRFVCRPRRQGDRAAQRLTWLGPLGCKFERQPP